MNIEVGIEQLLRLVFLLNLPIAIYIMLKVVLNNRNPVKTVAWILVLFFLPLLGLLLYFFFGWDTRRLRYINRRSLSQIQRRSKLSYPEHITPDIPANYAGLISFFENSADAHLTGHTTVDIINNGQDFMQALLREVSEAKEHIHLMFYIFEDDATGHALRDALVEKAREGVEVRVIYDSVGCWSVKTSFFDEIRKAGGYVASFLKVRFPLLTNKINYRNHRKVVVIDGKVGFVGGFNVADRYVTGGKWNEWRDTMLVLRGSAVYGLQITFLVDWFFADSSLVSGKRYFPALNHDKGALAQIVTSNPVGYCRIIMSGLTISLLNAKNYVYIQTPYLMPNETVLMAIQNAAQSGVDVRLMIPLRADSRIADYAAYSYLGELLNVGVKVYLYEKGFLHSKMLVADDMLSTVGSANLDFRSFYYNFEVNAYIYDANVASRLKAMFMEDIKSCRQLTLREYKERPMSRRCLESGARLLSPLL